MRNKLLRARQTEQIEKLNEADNVLKLNAELKKQNEKLKQDKLNAEQEAEATVSSVKREYEAKGRELDRRIGEAAKQSASLKSERQSLTLPTAKAGGFLFLPPLHWQIPYGTAMSYLVHIVYVLIRWYVKGCMRSRGYY